MPTPGYTCPDGFRLTLIDELENEPDFESNAQSFMGAWNIKSVVNGWIEDDQHYPGIVERDCGVR